ncbi:MAG: hypothetical protein QOJ29_5310, partial [Thermoleophilaceae bacterium]|nr:hypothetical protein [Thermoleophilaceae bacterium]
VKRITVIRDTPKMRGDTDTCVLRAMSAHKRAGVACALPRRESLIRDPAVGAARRHPPRVRYVDLTRYFCDSRKCFPVIGGALVYKDATHITSVYGRTLGPYLLRALGYAHDHQRARDGQRRPARLSPAPPTAWPRCFGAAARDPRAQPCVNPRLRHWVVPSPREARGRPNAPCKVIEHSDEVSPCEFGQVVGVPALTIALVGDSHASHWRAALDVAATAKHWRGLSIMKTSCPFSKAFRILVERNRSTACVRWKREIFPWFRRHPEVRTVFVVGLAASDVAHRGGQSEFAAAVAGYASAWKALPTSVERIVVIRDTPIVPHRTRKCVERAIARRRSAGLACAVPRALALHPDPAVAAAARMHSRRVRVMDLTRYFCDSRRCFPVIGGALVYKDTTHITAVFAETVGQFMLRKLGG